MKIDDTLPYWAAVKGDLKVFLRQSFATMHPSSEYMDSWHIDAMVGSLEKAMRGKQPRTIVNIPPRSLKSFLFSIAWPAFVLGHDPTAKIIVVSYSDELARALSREFKRLLDEPWYQRLFPNVHLIKASEGELATDQGGFRYATSVGGTLTGRGADIIILDDPIKPTDALSDRPRNSANEWLGTTLLSRLDDKERGILLVVMQRLHVNDPTGFLEAGGQFKKLSLPAIAPHDAHIPMRNGRVHFRQAGTVLHEERESLETLHKLSDQLGPLTFAAQYQQHPQAPEGTMFKRAWLQRTPKIPRFQPNGKIYVSIDAASSTSDTADYSAISLVYAYDTKYHVLRAERGRWDFEALYRKAMAFQDLVAGHQVSFLIERAGAGISLIQQLLRNRVPNVFHYPPKDGKVTRAAYAVPAFHQLRVFIVDRPGSNRWVEPYVNEILSFPHGRFDDQVDSLVQLINFGDHGRNRAASEYYYN